MFWFHQDLERLENQIQELEYDPKLIFYGSSTFTLWRRLFNAPVFHKTRDGVAPPGMPGSGARH